jgi:hypothetical protein
MSVNIFGGSGKFSNSVNKRYVDQKFTTLSTNLASKVNKSGDSVLGDLNILLNEDVLRTFGVSDIAIGKSVSCLFGDQDNQIRHNFGHAWKIMASCGVKFACASGETCRMGSVSDARATFFKDIVMNGNSVTELHNPKKPQDAATKNYVDNVQKKCYNGYIPILEANHSRLGFHASSSGNISNKCQPYGAFNNLHPDGNNGSWVAPSSNGWLQIKCPDQVTIWRVALKARHIPGRDITNWNLTASNDGTAFVTLLTSTTTLLGSATEPTFFEVTTNETYQYFRLNITASNGSPDCGIQVFQLYLMLI